MGTTDDQEASAKTLKKNSSKHSRTLSLKLSESFEREIETYAERHGLSKSSVVREAVREYLVREGAAMSGSFLVRAADLAGAIDGEPDLSTNRERLKGYGR